MNRGLTVLLQLAIVLLGIGALAFLLVEPRFEGRNAHATVFEIYFKDPFLAYAYLASIPFFVAHYQAFKALGHARQGKTVLPELRTIKYCALAVVGFVAVSFTFLGFSSDYDDRPAGIVMRLLVALPAAGVAVAARKFERAAK